MPDPVVSSCSVRCGLKESNSMADSVNAYTRPTPAQVQELLRQGRGVLLFEAVICIVGGFFAILFPFFASAGIELMLGILCTMLGVLGVLLLMWPFEGLEAITLVLAVSCLVRGIAELSGFPHRSVMAPGMQMISGVAGIVIAGLLFWWYPDVLWAPGLFFGIQLLFFGMMLVTLWNIAGAPVANPPATNTKG